MLSNTKTKAEFVTELAHLERMPLGANALLSQAGFTVEDAIGDRWLHLPEWSTLLAYMYRRFGPPNFFGSPDVDFAGKWIVTTPLHDIFVVVAPSPDHGYEQIQFFVSKERFQKLSVAEVAEDFLPKAGELFVSLLEDLERGVKTPRGVINSHGHTENKRNDLPPAAHACRAFPTKLIADDRFVKQLCPAIHALGDGDFVEGQKRAVANLTEGVWNQARGAWRGVREMMVMLARKSDLPVLCAKIDVSMNRAQNLQKSLLGIQEMSAIRDARALDSFREHCAGVTYEDVKQAIRYMNGVGLRARSVNPLDLLRTAEYQDKCEGCLLDLLAENPLDDSQYPPTEVWGSGVYLCDQMGAYFRGIGRADIGSWILTSRDNVPSSDETNEKASDVGREVVCQALLAAFYREGETPVVSIPGSPSAVNSAMNELIKSSPQI
ncbi:hypothetical protein ACFOY8_14910 [Thalassospira xianhensis]|uniref:Uncharacterized protein n=1 Tax=Thalassospira xianhensis MCCC 1A02616 TaxID=1177929 RepID=A0A367UJR0_9PROT|nr:hypothetical protein [Thalassospira xianhensis]RCK07564.1 hypothetical protein TH5_00315 [Thalassospira xianhensis MCCC 1A02616]